LEEGEKIRLKINALKGHGLRWIIYLGMKKLFIRIHS